jgi:hypothetical protein
MKAMGLIFNGPLNPSKQPEYALLRVPKQLPKTAVQGKIDWSFGCPFRNVDDCELLSQQEGPQRMIVCEGGCE